MRSGSRQGAVPPENPVADSAAPIRVFLEANADSLLAILRSYVCRGGLAGRDGVQETAIELLGDVVIEALDHADRFDASRQPMAWVLGIAANLVRRRQAEGARRAHREPLLRDTLSPIGEEVFFERFLDLAAPSPERAVLAEAQAAAMLALVPREDAEVLRLAVIHELSGEALAQALGIAPGAARVRVHRARTRLRDAWLKAQAEGAE